MAGLKETPRQKLIGLMYLVLLALLALQVSSAIVYKFQFLNNSLEGFVKDSEQRSRQRLNNIAEQVKLRGNRPTEVSLNNLSVEISEKSDTLISYIENLKNQLVQETGGYEENGNLKGAQEETAVEVFMLGTSRQGKAYELKKKLDAYVNFINSTGLVTISKMALDGKEHQIFQHNSEQRAKDFAELNFGQTPLVAGLATLSEIEARISTVKAASLAVITDKIGSGDYAIDRLVPMVRPSSKVVVAGTKYDAQLFMAATSSSQKPKMKAGGREIDVDMNGIGKFTFTASGGNYNRDGFLKKTWKGDISVKKPDGNDTTYTITEEYLVAKPTIQVQSAVVKTLYRNCGNVLDIQVPALGADYNPVITATGAQVEKGDRKGVVIVIPKDPVSVIKVNSGSAFIGEEKYGVKLVPLPRIEARIRSKAVNAVAGAEAADLRFFSLKAVADREFAETLPRDARYMVAEWKATLARRKNIVKTETMKGESPSLQAFSSLAVTGDRLVIEVTKVLRKNFRDQVEDVKVAETIVIPIN